MSWLFVKHPDSDPVHVPEAALQAAPVEVARALDPMLPRATRDGPCRICGTHARLSREHVPPRSAGNAGPGIEHTLAEWFEASKDELPQGIPGGRVIQGGIWGRTLCESCNNFTGTNYVPEYKGWAARAAKCLRELTPADELNARDSYTRANVVFKDVDPGAFVRASLAAMCSVSASWDIASRHRVIRRIILGGEVQPLPDGMRLYLSMYWGPLARICGPSLHVDRETNDWEWILEVAVPPLALLMVLTGTGKEPGLFEIGEWTLRPAGKRANFEGELDVSFGNVPYPGDYRTRAQIDADGRQSS